MFELGRLAHLAINYNIKTLLKINSPDFLIVRFPHFCCPLKSFKYTLMCYYNYLISTVQKLSAAFAVSVLWFQPLCELFSVWANPVLMGLSVCLSVSLLERSGLSVHFSARLWHVTYMQYFIPSAMESWQLISGHSPPERKLNFLDHVLGKDLIVKGMHNHLTSSLMKFSNTVMCPPFLHHSNL